VKVQILRPDEFLRPEMNATVRFKADEKEVRSGAVEFRGAPGRVSR
jgi:hypothetical protein